MDISTVIVNWNTASLLEQCLKSIDAYMPATFESEVIVVDNGSTDGSIEMVRETFPAVNLLVNERNEGYQRANNRGISATSGDFILLLNADAMLASGAVEAMHARLVDDPRNAIVGPRLVYGDGTFQRWTAGRMPTLVSIASFYLFIERVSDRAAARSLFLSCDRRDAFEPEWVTSACMLVRRETLEHTGLLDERYFCYMDDVDLCQRARARGWSVWYEPAATVVHLMGAASGRTAGGASPAAIRNFNDYVGLRHGPAVEALARACEFAGFSARAAAYAARAVRYRNGDLAHARAHARNARVSLKRGRV